MAVGKKQIQAFEQIKNLRVALILRPVPNRRECPHVQGRTRVAFADLGNRMHKVRVVPHEETDLCGLDRFRGL